MANSTFSNGYSWNAGALLKDIIAQRGQSMVVFINGIWTDSEDFKSQRNSVRQNLGLIDWLSTNSEFQSSFRSFRETDPEVGEEFSALFKSVYNPSKGKDQDNSPQFSTFARILADKLFGYALEQYRSKELDTNDETYKHIKKNLVDEAYHFSWFGGFPKVFTQGSSDRERVARFLEEHGDLEGFADRISYAEGGFDPPSDLIEALSQYFSDKPSSVSNKVNIKWTQDAVDWLENSKNSLILVGHSQGNLFLEDALMGSEFGNIDGSRIRVVSLGSPTDYSAVAQYGHLTGGGGSDFRNLDDPVSELRSPFGTSNRQKVVTALTALNAWNIVGNLDKHNLNGGEYAYIEKPEVKNQFEKFFYELHERGYYFRNGPTEQEEGTKDGDWLEGNDNKKNRIHGRSGNDVLRGKGMDDTLSGDEGYDFLDGGSGSDTADYSNSPARIILNTTKIAGSDVYQVSDGYGAEAD